MVYQPNAEKFSNYRARRYYTCRMCGDLQDIIDMLGKEDGSECPPLDRELPEEPSDAVKRELKNTVIATQRLILALNDGGLSDQKLKTF